MKVLRKPYFVHCTQSIKRQPASTQACDEAVTSRIVFKVPESNATSGVGFGGLVVTA